MTNHKASAFDGINDIAKVIIPFFWRQVDYAEDE